MASACTTTLYHDAKAFTTRFHAQYLITMRDDETKTMYISVWPIRDVTNNVSTGRLIGYYFMKKAWRDGKYTPHNALFGSTLNKFENLSFRIASIVSRSIDKDADLPIGPAPVGLADVTFEFQWKEDGCPITASQVMSFQTITPEQFAAEF